MAQSEPYSSCMHEYLALLCRHWPHKENGRRNEEGSVG